MQLDYYLSKKIGKKIWIFENQKFNIHKFWFLYIQYSESHFIVFCNVVPDVLWNNLNMKLKKVLILTSSAMMNLNETSKKVKEYKYDCWSLFEVF